MNNYGNFVKPPLLIIALFLPLFTLSATSANSSSTAEGIIINELLPSPDGPDEEEEWIELFNKNDFEVELTGWRLADVKGKVKNYVFPNKTIIPAKNFLVLSRQQTKITLNNDSDGLMLIKPDGKISDRVNYERARRAESYNRKGSAWIWSKVLTPGAANKSAEPKPETPKAKENLNQSALAAINKPVVNNFFPPLIALVLSFLSAAVILLLKRKLTKNLTPD